MKIITWKKEIELLSGEYIETGISIPTGIISLVDCAIKGIVSKERAIVLKAQLLTAYSSSYRIEEIQIIPSSNGSFDLLFNLDNFNLQIRE